MYALTTLEKALHFVSRLYDEAISFGGYQIQTAEFLYIYLSFALNVKMLRSRLVDQLCRHAQRTDN